MTQTVIRGKHQRSQVPHCGALQSFHIGNLHIWLQVGEVSMVKSTMFTLPQRLEAVMDSSFRGTLPSMPQQGAAHIALPLPLSLRSPQTSSLSRISFTPLVPLQRNCSLEFSHQKEKKTKKQKKTHYLTVCFAFCIHLMKIQFFHNHDYF